MTKFKIVTDSGCLGDINFYKENKIDIVPFQAIIDGKYYLLDENFPLTNEYLEKVISSKKDFIVSKPNYLDIKNIYERPLKAGEDLLILHSSSNVVDIISSANLAIKDLKEIYPERKIFLIDTETVACGIDLLIKEVIEKKDLDILQAVDYIKSINYKIASRIIINKHSLSDKKKESSLFKKNIILKENNGYITPYNYFFLVNTAIYSEILAMRKNINTHYSQVYLVCSKKYKHLNKIINLIKKSIDSDVIVMEPNPLFLNLTGKKSIGLFYVKR